MSEGKRTRWSDYMRFAKRETPAAFNLASSGIANRELADLGCELSALSLHGDNAYGHAPLVERIAARFGVPTECVVTAEGTSFANHLAMAAVLDPGDEVAIEDPTYELLASTLAYLGARLVRFERRPNQGWRLDVDAVVGALSERTRLVVITNLHNPTSVLTPPDVLAEAAVAASRVGAWLLVDEVYLELTFGAGSAWTAFRPDGNVIVTSSLTKAYGLSGLRCGWILAAAPLAERMRRLNDLFAATPVHLAEQLAIAALDRLDLLRARSLETIDANRSAYRERLADHPALEQLISDEGTTVFPRLRFEDGQAFFERLKRDHQTTVVPGRFFGRSDHIRVGLGGDVGATREGLTRIARALEEGPQPRR